MYIRAIRFPPPPCPEMLPAPLVYLSRMREFLSKIYDLVELAAFFWQVEV